MKPLLSILLTAFLIACSTARFQPRQSETCIPDIPVYEQTGTNCGPATLASILNFYGIPATPDSVQTTIHRDTIEGTLTLDMVVYAKSKGLDARLFRSSKDDLLQHIDNGVPLICMIEIDDLNPFGGLTRMITSEEPSKHYVLVIGYSTKQNTIIAHTGDKQPKRIDMDDFMQSWQKAGFVAIEVM